MADTKPRLRVEDGAGTEARRTLEGKAAKVVDDQPRSDVAQPEAAQPAGAGAVEGAPKRSGNPFSNARRATSDWLGRNFPGHENAVFGGICGLVVALLVFVMGFWRTLFVVVCVLVGVAVGQYLDGNPTVVRAVRKFFDNGSK